MAKGSVWIRIAAAIAPIALLVAGASARAEDKPKPDDLVNNPPYENWSSFPVGTSVSQKETIQLNDGTTVAIDIVSKLLQKTKESVVVETSMGEAGASAKTGDAAASTTTTTFPAKVKMSQVNSPADASLSVTEGTEAFSYLGKTVTAEWTSAVARNGDEVTEDKMWTLKDVPGGILRQTIVKKKGGQVVSSSTTELVTVKPGAS